MWFRGEALALSERWGIIPLAFYYYIYYSIIMLAQRQGRALRATEGVSAPRIGRPTGQSKRPHGLTMRKRRCLLTRLFLIVVADRIECSAGCQSGCAVPEEAIDDVGGVAGGDR